MDLRKRRITASLDLSGQGLEYGPLHTPIVQKSTSLRIRYVDFTDRQSLVEKYAKDPNVDVSKISEIEVVTDGRPIDQFVAPNSQDFIVASHVMEHVPDFIGWLESNMRVLKKGGRIAIAFPDRRYCFDIARNPTLFSEMVAAYFEKRTRPSFAQICDHFINVRKVPLADAWSKQKNPETYELIHNTEAIIKTLGELHGKDQYTDVHCWKSSDEEYLKILGQAETHFKIGFDIISFFPTQRNSHEFFVTLEKRN